ncbi:MAG TPA: J domain-containing protein [Rhizomicrobium sp.]|jgi:DnaJ-domain-containing protein 1|nr:J domain-containing protein [Rhizomicrobium sp.]
MDGTSLSATMFLPMQGRISDVLNDERQFLPLESNGEHLALAKATIRQVRFPAAKAPYRSKCPYSVLGLKEGATIEEIKKAYRELCTANHPDRVRGSGLGQDFVEFATENMMRINSAYAQLTKGIAQRAA